MSYFPMCVDLSGKDAILIGSGEQIRDKAEKLAAFGARIVVQKAFTEQDAQSDPVMVVVGDEATEAAESIYSLCKKYHIPINVVDMPQWCSFSFPALIQNGDLTVSVSTGGKCPGFAAMLRDTLRAAIPEQAGEILNWLHCIRPNIRKLGSFLQTRRIFQMLIRQSMAYNRPLTPEETQDIIRQTTDSNA